MDHYPVWGVKFCSEPCVEFCICIIVPVLQGWNFWLSCRHTWQFVTC